MKKQELKKIVAFVLAGIMAAFVVTGCGNVKEESVVAEPFTDTSIEENSVPLADSFEIGASLEASEEHKTAYYFSKGVYANYSKELENPSKDYFYVFNTDTYGYTDDGANNDVGLPFDFTQEDGKVTFSFGGATSTEAVLIVTSFEKGIVTGYFEDIPERELVFEPVPDADPDNFLGANYLSDGEFIYHNANGWSIKYDPNLFDITQDGPKVAIVYNGECSGTNMIMSTYDADTKGKEARDLRVKDWGETTTASEGIFPGTEDVPGYWASCPAGEGGSGIYMTSVSRDYMDGSLTFEFIGHLSGNEELDTEVSDYMAGIIDSITFEFE